MPIAAWLMRTVTSCPLCSLHCCQASSSNHTSSQPIYPAQSHGNNDFDYLFGGLCPIFPVADINMPLDWPVVDAPYPDAEVDAFFYTSHQVEIPSMTFLIFSDSYEDSGTR